MSFHSLGFVRRGSNGPRKISTDRSLDSRHCAELSVFNVTVAHHAKYETEVVIGLSLLQWNVRLNLRTNYRRPVLPH